MLNGGPPDKSMTTNGLIVAEGLLSMFGKMSLKVRMLVSFGWVAAFLLIVGGAGRYALNDVSGKFSHVASVNLSHALTLNEMESTAKDVRSVISVLGFPDTKADEAHMFREIYHETVKEYDGIVQSYQQLTFVEGEQALFDAQMASWKNYVTVSSKLVELSKFQTPADKVEFYKLLKTDFRTAAQGHLAAVRALVEFQTSESKKWVSMAETSASRMNWVTLVVVFAGFGMAMGVGLMMSRVLALRLTLLSDRLAQEASRVADASETISDSSASLSRSASEQGTILRETVSVVDEVSAMVEKNADNAKRSQGMSEQSRHTAEKGKQAVERMIHSIEEINSSNTDIVSQIDLSNRELGEIVQVISAIGSKTKVINDIVFQTRLLSFNASVEAARAGEHGKGFAVVAEEVGKLAQMSGQSAQEITLLLEGSVHKVEGIVKNTKSRVEGLVSTGQAKILSGTVTARECGAVLSEIFESVSEVNRMMAEVVAASDEQAAGVQDITRAMGHFDQVTQKNSMYSKQSAGAANQLREQSETLKALVTDLVRTIKGEAGLAEIELAEAEQARSSDDSDLEREAA